MKQKVNFPLVVVFIILLGALFLVVAFQYDFSFQKEEQQNQEQEEVNIFNWNSYTYLSSQSGILPDISFEYPSLFGDGPTLVSSRNVNPPENITDDWGGLLMFNSAEAYGDHSLQMNFFIKDNTGSNLESYVIKNSIAGSWGSPKYFQAGDSKVARLRYDSKSQYDADIGWYFIMLPDKKILAISTSGDIDFLYDDIDGMSTRDKIISTFKIIDFLVETEEFSINWINGEDYSEHVGSKKAEFEIEKKGEVYGYTKELVWPELKNIVEENIYKKINKLIDFNNEVEFSEYDTLGHNGITGTSFDVNYDRDDILSLTVYIESYGAYPYTSVSTKNINLKTGNLIGIEDIVSKNKIDELVSLCDLKLQESVDEKIDEYGENDLYKGIVFRKENLVYFKIKENGLEFSSGVSFPHVAKAMEPNPYISLSYDDLGDLIIDGLLKNELIKLL